MAREIASKPTVAIWGSKHSIQYARNHSTADALKQMGWLQSGISDTAAIFGKKDYQQLAVMKQKVAQFAMPIRVVGAKTVRESDGLAMSSRNAFLCKSERAQAKLPSQQMQMVGQNIANNPLNADSLRSVELQAIEALKREGWEPDYFAICNQNDLTPATSTMSKDSDKNLVILAAARIGKTRLID